MESFHKDELLALAAGDDVEDKEVLAVEYVGFSGHIQYGLLVFRWDERLWGAYFQQPVTDVLGQSQVEFQSETVFDTHTEVLVPEFKEINKRGRAFYVPLIEEAQ